MKLYNFKIKRAQEANHNHFFLQNVPNNEIFQIFKMFQNNIWVNVYYTKINACSPWTVCSVFVWKCIFWVNLVQKLKSISWSWNFVPRLIQICRILWWCSFFRLEIPFLGKFGLKIQDGPFDLKFCTKLIWIHRIM